MPDRTYLVLDIETIPDRDIYSAPDPPVGTERPFPPPYAHRPVVIGVMWLDENLACKRIGTIGEGKSEAEMMADFADFTNKWSPQIVSWNGRTFDLPVLTLRALRHGLSLGWYFQGNGYRYRFSDQGHLDLCDGLADYGAAKPTPLDAAARLIGLPGKQGVDGSQVEGLWNAGHLDELRRYCLSDVAQTAFLFLRYRLLAGSLDRPTYCRVAADLLAVVEGDERLSDLAERTDRKRLLLGG